VLVSERLQKEPVDGYLGIIMFALASHQH
jgi:hypothetical protein